MHLENTASNRECSSISIHFNCQRAVINYFKVKTSKQQIQGLTEVLRSPCPYIWHLNMPHLSVQEPDLQLSHKLSELK